MTLARLLKSATAECLYRSGALSLHRVLLERGRGIVLMYHRVNDDGDPFFPSLPVSVFSKQLDYLAQHYRVESLESLLEWVDSGARGTPRVALTIDDGYLDTFENMRPALEKRGLTATLFLSTSPVETGRPLWTERVRRAFKQATRGSLDLSAVGLGVRDLAGTSDRLGAMRLLLSRLKREKSAVLEEICDRVEERLRPEGPFPGTLTWDRIREMAARGRFEIGAHTHRHYLLSSLGDDEMEAEIKTSVDLIERRVGRKVRLFCYPNGQNRDYDSRSFAVLGSLGIRYAVCAEAGFVRPGCEPLELPRIYTSESSLPLFATRLAGLGALGRNGAANGKEVQR